MSLNSGISFELDKLSSDGFDGLGNKSGSDVEYDDYGGKIQDAINSLDNAYSEFKQAANSSNAAVAGLAMNKSIGIAAIAAGHFLPPGVANIAASAFKLFFGTLSKIGDNAQIRSKWVRCRKIERIISDKMPEGEPAAYLVRLQDYRWTDCTPITDSRRKLPVTAQRKFAPWSIWSTGDNFLYPQPQGWYNKGFKVRCGVGSNAGEGNTAREAKPSGSRPRGCADFSSLLYPWWCGNGPPRPAPAIDKTSIAKNHYFSDPNLSLMVLQQRLLGDPLTNFLCHINKVISMKAALESFAMGDLRIENANETFQCTPSQVYSAIELCNTFINARVSILKSKEGQKVLDGTINFPDIDPTLKDAYINSPPAYALPKYMSIAVAERKPKTPKPESKEGIITGSREPVRDVSHLDVAVTGKKKKKKNKKSDNSIIILGAGAAATYMFMKNK